MQSWLSLRHICFLSGRSCSTFECAGTVLIFNFSHEGRNFMGGLGTCISEETYLKPKPMVEIAASQFCGTFSRFLVSMASMNS